MSLTSLKQYVLARLQERSTLMGLLGFVIAGGWVSTPDQSNAIATVVVTIASTYAVFSKG